MTTRVYTKTEKTQRARLLVKGAKRSAGDVSAIERQIETIDRRAEDRARREQAAYQRQLEEARNALASARVAERTAPRGAERAAAREARKEAEKRLRTVERAAR